MINEVINDTMMSLYNESDSSITQNLLIMDSINIMLYQRSNCKLEFKQSSTLNIFRSQEIDSLKLEIQEKFNIPIEDQELIFNGKILKNIQQLKDSRIVNSLYIIYKQPLKLEVITIESYNNHSMQIQIQDKKTIMDLKQQIYHEKGIPIDSQRLIWNGKSMNNESTFQEVISDSPKKLLLNIAQKGGFMMKIKTIKQQVYELDVELTDTVINIKYQLENQLGCDRNSLKIIYNGRILKDEQTLKEINFQPNEFVVAMFGRIGG